MKLWKASIAAALLAMSASSGAFAVEVTSSTPTGPSVYASYNPSNPGYNGVPNPYTQSQNQQMVPGQVQQYYNNLMAPPGTVPPGQLANNSGQPQPAVQYHYKNPNPSNGFVPDDQLPQRLFHNIPPRYYGVAGDCTCVK